MTTNSTKQSDNFYQIMADGSIAFGPDPEGPTSSEILKSIETALNSDGYSFSWSSKKHLPYEGDLDTGLNTIHLYIYAWRITNGGKGRNRPSEKRIQIQNNVNNIGFEQAISDTNKTLLLGIYNSPTETPIFAAWDAISNANHTQKSCFVQVEDLQASLSEQIHQCKDSRNNIIYTFLPEALGDYIDLVNSGNTMVLSKNATGTLLQKVKASTLPSRKRRTINSTKKILAQIQGLSATEKMLLLKNELGKISLKIY